VAPGAAIAFAALQLCNPCSLARTATLRQAKDERPRGRSWNQRASDDDPTFCCTVYAHLLVADQVADEH
jgi:hypothetical protein